MRIVDLSFHILIWRDSQSISEIALLELLLTVG